MGFKSKFITGNITFVPKAPHLPAIPIPVPTPIHQKRAFEELNNLLKLEINHAAFGTTGEMRWRNHLPHARLFLIHAIAAGTQHGGTVRNWSHPDTPEIRLRAGMVYCIPAAQEIEGHFLPGLCIVGFHLGLEAFPGNDIFAGDDAFHERSGQEAVISELAGLADRELELGETVRVRGLVHALAGLFVQRSTEDIRRLIALRGRYRGIFDELEAHPNAQTTVSQLARSLGMRREFLSRAFARDVGQPLKTYMGDRLAAVACERLAHGDEAIRTISRELGFSSEAYFSRFIRNHTRHTPLHYRRMRQRWDGFL